MHESSIYYHYRINQKNKVNLLIFLFLFSCFALVAKSYTPMEYKGGLYCPKKYSSYEAISRDNLMVLTLSTIDDILNLNYIEDNRIKNELVSILATLFKEEEFLLLNNKANDLLLKLPPPLELNLSSQIDIGKFANVKRYHLLPSKEAVVNFFEDGTIQVEYNDGSVYVQTSDYYFKNRPDSTTEYIIYFDGRAIITSDGNTLHLNQDGSYSLTFYHNNNEYIFSYSQNPTSQYHIQMPFPNGKSYKRVWLVPTDSSLGAASIFITDTLRADYFFEEKYILFSQGDKAILLYQDGTKVLSHFSQESACPFGVCSYILPEGVRYDGLEENEIRATFKPVWNNFEATQIGPFCFWALPKDKKYLLLLKESKLLDVVNEVHSHFNLPLDNKALQGINKIDVLIPPTLKDFAELYVTRENQYLSWYPSGFQVQNYITLWPLSATRYKESSGQRWFFNQEIYQILAHEYTHFLIAHLVGYVSQIPVWLNEGLAVSHELIFSKENFESWESCYKEAFSQDRLLDWNLMVKGVSGDFSFKEAQIFYAQSYMMTKFLMEKFGGEAMLKYITLFKVDILSESKESFWQENFIKAFGLSWEENLEAFKDFSLGLF